ncbi:MAG: hypothetical protein FWD88_01480 [Treponema sp.]|nr:hypothetical protein [Treponema sp.]
MAHDRTGVVKFWGRIPDVLTARGISVHLGNTDAWGDYASNALTLKQTIENVLLETGKERVNIIAHSKGGIDARYLIWKHAFGDKIASLTTICTPHHGSEVADLIHNRKITHTKPARKILSIFGKLYGDTNPNLYDVIFQLTTAEMKKFNAQVAMDARVFYQSLYATMDNAFDDMLFFYPYLYISKTRGENDGIVSAHSAKWGKNIAKIEGGISHAEILDFKMKKISAVDIPGVYVQIVEGLSQNNF